MSGVLGAGHNGDATGRSLAREVNGRTRRLMYQLLRPRQERGSKNLASVLDEVIRNKDTRESGKHVASELR
jgi:hypothetical protein